MTRILSYSRGSCFKSQLLTTAHTNGKNQTQEKEKKRKQKKTKEKKRKEKKISQIVLGRQVEIQISITKINEIVEAMHY